MALLSLKLDLASQTTEEGARNAGQVFLRQTAPNQDDDAVKLMVSYPDMEQGKQRTITVKPSDKPVSPEDVSKSIAKAMPKAFE